MISIVCGGRDYQNRARVNQILDAAVTRLGLTTIIHGMATGADTLAHEWASARDDVSIIAVPANWDMGKNAGPARNQMLLTILLRFKEMGDEICLFAFPGGSGTAHMVKIAKIAGVRIIEVQ